MATRAAKSKRKAKEQPAPAETTIAAFKGFDQNLRCRDFQFEVNKTYEHKGAVKMCATGFHACQSPLDVFGYYPPGTSRYASVTQSGPHAFHDEDSKVVSAKIKIEAELKLPDFISAAVKWLIDHATPATSNHSTGDRSAASSTGYQSAASSTGYRSAASSTGDRSAASSTGYQSAASSTGGRSAALSTGYQSAASSTGGQSAAMSSGRYGRVMGAEGCALFLVRRDDSWKITHAWAGIAGKDGIKPLTWYTLDENGKPQKVSA